MDLFGTAGIRGSAQGRVTPDLALAVGRAAGRNATEFVVGRDGRETGDALEAAMAAGLESAGADVRLLGRVPTPALAWASRGRHGVMLTASHNPPEDNGIKLFADGSEYGDAMETEVEARVADRDDPVAWDAWGARERVAVLDDYRAAVLDYARGHGAPLDGLHVACDCGNGMAARAVPQTLRELGAHVVTLNANIDGHFPGRPSKPTPETVRDLRAFVADGDADLGLAHDGDADRIVVVDGAGAVVHEDTVLAVLAEHYVAASDVADPVVVTTPNASGRIDERVRAAGGRTERVRLGALHEGIASAREGGGDVVFAAEPWKHIHTQFGGWIDGVVSAAVLARLVADAGGLDALRAPVTERPYRKLSVDCPDEAKDAVMDALADDLPAALPDADVSTAYGVRLTLPDDAWTLVRPSGTEPYVRIYAESDDVDALVDAVRAVVESAVADATGA
ncbi:phosphomannomutase / phosphoglucosamine mutase [Halarchaeum acidiphilum MH1-52-1]|uniref:Phosphomannomutase / phosphoglucosamine mutase n=1 Tax=Halarchaeum acidiphilum MH1-52-1 TaxID=1261545 RepID=U3A5Q5_9EURY|nr:phosphomannomutase / phosphoglucosamine mutase [Halarchaeum acidiphilum]GAD52984.1 phosphomannomutase / phosphoglucosamine mutase [Halarchaeum acidiphilum MH1-52-1]